MTHIKTRMVLPTDIIEIHQLFDEKNLELYIVGGAVRDHLRGKQPHDFDLVTNATPDIIQSILSGYMTDLQGVQFGVVRVFTKSEPMGYEIATFRQDLSNGRDTKSNSEKVIFGDGVTIYDDCKRRDFTQNALFYDIKNNHIVDIVGGVEDIKNNIIRAVGEPKLRFNEDRLRIIRAIRFCATNKESILDETTSDAIQSDNRLFGIGDGIDVSRERIIAEFNKVSEKAISDDDDSYLPKFIQLLNEYGLLSVIFGDVKISQTKPTTSLLFTFAMLLSTNTIDKAFQSKLRDFKFSNKFIDHLCFLISFSKTEIDGNLAYKLHKNMTSIQLSKNTLNEFLLFSNQLTIENISFLIYQPTINGNDLLKDGFYGAELGAEIIRRESLLFNTLRNY